MKTWIKYILQKLFGFRTYLFVFAKYKIRTLRRDKKENHFFHFLGMLKDGEGIVLDIGANLGIMTVHLAQTLPNSTIHAFEPMPDNQEIFKKIVAKYQLKNVKFHEVALGDSDGTVKMILPEKDGAKFQGLSHVKHDSITEWNEGTEFEVPIKPLDSIFGEEKIQGIKMDVENFEYFVLKGGKELLAKHKPIIYTELWDNENRQNCFTLLKELGYSTLAVKGDKLVPFNCDDHDVQNFIFTAN
ncbi:MAG: FkbM family methyltransferase [Crocinitomicaceae bacterium]